jgi:hypothetical protein
MRPAVACEMLALFGAAATIASLARHVMNRARSTKPADDGQVHILATDLDGRWHRCGGIGAGRDDHELVRTAHLIGPVRMVRGVSKMTQKTFAAMGCHPGGGKNYVPILGSGHIRLTDLVSPLVIRTPPLNAKPEVVAVILHLGKEALVSGKLQAERRPSPYLCVVAHRDLDAWGIVIQRAGGRARGGDGVGR